uniref:uncharacterized protein LOC129516487 n=1 Tax=Nyctereutes procyonoides TaxID=34880 RepID=UPI0024447AC0|nr:uncharacterized protein LOC129516487 [Nyctereutes procyonoides]
MRPRRQAGRRGRSRPPTPTLPPGQDRQHHGRSGTSRRRHRLTGERRDQRRAGVGKSKPSSRPRFAPNLRTLKGGAGRGASARQTARGGSPAQRVFSRRKSRLLATCIGCASPPRKRGRFRRRVCVLAVPEPPPRGRVAANRYREAECLLADATVLHVASADQFLPARRQFCELLIPTIVLPEERPRKGGCLAEVGSDEKLDRESGCWKGGCRPRVRPRSRPRRVRVFGLVQGLAFPLQMGHKIRLTGCFSSEHR